MRTKKQIREGTHDVSRRQQRATAGLDGAGALKPGEVWVCGACGKVTKSKPALGSCIGHRVRCLEASLVYEDGRLVKADPV